MNVIGREEFKCILITCEIDGRECDEYDSCSTCPIAIETVKKDVAQEYEDYIQLIDPKRGTTNPKSKYKYILNKDNTIAMYNSFIEFKLDQFLPIDIYSYVKHGHCIKTWLHFPVWYELQHLLHLGIPDYYMFRNNENPLVAVYPDAVYITAPRIDPDEEEEV